MDDRLTDFHQLTFRNRLQNFWHRCLLYGNGVRYTLQLLRFTYQNVLVLRHFQRCRKVDVPAPVRTKTRFPYLDFYKRTWQQSRKLFTPLRSSATHVSPLATEGIREDKGTIALHAVRKPKVDRNNLLQFRSPLLQVEALPARAASHECAQHRQTTTPAKRKRRTLWTTLQKGVLTIWHLPYFLLWKLGTFFRTRLFKVKLQSLYQQQQSELLREQQRLMASTQTALFLSLANTIDLQTTRELAMLCQHVSRARQKRKMTEEDLACFDQSVTDLDKNHEVLRDAA